jgi:hypothetical protein
MRIVFICCFICIITNLFASGNGEIAPEVLEVSTVTSVPDGKIAEKEYSLSLEMDKMQLHISRDNEKVTFGVVGDEGWISIGFGEPVMDNALIYIGYVKDGEVFMKNHIGKGHRHEEADIPSLIQYKFSEVDGITTFEGEIALSDIIPEGGTQLNIIVGCSNADNFKKRHSFRKGLSISLS